jgi:hypothetical protein
VREVTIAAMQGNAGRPSGRTAASRAAATMRRAAAAGTLLLAAATAAAAQGPVQGPVPADLDPGAGFVAFLRTSAVGTQNYACVAPGTPAPWKFTGPQATLYVPVFGAWQQIATHFLSANPDEPGVNRPTWQHSLDTSRVWARPVVVIEDPQVVAPGAVAWLLLEVAGKQRGPAGGQWLGQAKYIQRINTKGGVAPATGCAVAADLGKLALVPYSTDYVFFRAAH